MSNKKTWISIVIAAVIVVGILAVSAVGGTAYFIYRHVHTQFVPNDNAEQRFAEARGRLHLRAGPPQCRPEEHGGATIRGGSGAFRRAAAAHRDAPRQRRAGAAP